MEKIKEKFRLDLSADPCTITFSDDGKFLLIGSEVPEDKSVNDGYVSIVVWDLKTQKVSQTYCNKSNSQNAIQSIKVLKMDKENNFILSGHNTQGGVQRWSRETPESSVGALTTSSGVYIHDVELVDGKIFVVDGLNNQFLLDAKTLEIVKSCSDKPRPTPDDASAHETEPSNSIAKISPDGQFVLLEVEKNNHEDYFLEGRNFLSEEALWTVGPYSSDELVKHIFFGPNGQKIYCGGRKSSVDIYSRLTGELIQQIDTPASLDQMALSRDGKLLAEFFNTEFGFKALDNPYDLVLRDTATMKIIGQAKVPAGCISDLKISPDNTNICVTWARLIDKVLYNQIICFEIIA